MLSILKQRILRRGAPVAAAATMLLAACENGPTAPVLGDTTQDLAIAAPSFAQSAKSDGPKGTGKTTKTGNTTNTNTISAVETSTTETAKTSLGGTISAAGEYGLVRRKWPIDHDITRSRLIGPGGGQISILETGFLLEIPAGALAQTTEIVVTAKAGDYEVYEFGPHGIQFDLPVTMGFSTESVQTATALVAEAKGLYLDDADVPTVLETFSLSNQGFYVSFETTHFSRYSMGRSGGGWALATN